MYVCVGLFEVLCLDVGKPPAALQQQCPYHEGVVNEMLVSAHRQVCLCEQGLVEVVVFAREEEEQNMNVDFLAGVSLP